MESYDLVGIEKPLVKTEKQLLSEAQSLIIMIEEKYNRLNNLEGSLDKRLTKRIKPKIELFSDEEGIRTYLSSTINKLKGLMNNLDEKILNLQQQEEELEYDIKEHTIEGPDLRLWPLIENRLVIVEEYNKESKHHKLKGYFRYRHLNKK